ncbi:MAG: hypothetical protein Q4E29_01070 [Lachnospiraceae bacterium]|nr:hypothetical protein [Lachnospiraceae bacterium]
MSTKAAEREKKLDFLLNLLYEEGRSQIPKKGILDVCRELDDENFSKEELETLKKKVEILHTDNSSSLTIMISWDALIVSALAYIYSLIPGGNINLKLSFSNIQMMINDGGFGSAINFAIKVFMLIVVIVYFASVIKSRIKTNDEITKSKNTLLAIGILLEEYKEKEALNSLLAQDEPKEQSEEKNEE